MPKVECAHEFSPNVRHLRVSRREHNYMRAAEDNGTLHTDPRAERLLEFLLLHYIDADGHIVINFVEDDVSLLN